MTFREFSSEEITFFSPFSAPSLALFGSSVAIFLLYVTDWKVTNAKIPIYGRKFDEMKRAGLVEKHGQQAVDEGRTSDD